MGIEAELVMASARSSAQKLGRHGRYSATEVAEIATGKSCLPGGLLGGNTLADDARFVFHHAEGARFWDVSGNEYVDYCIGSGSLILGHAHPAIQRALLAQIPKGTHYFAFLNEPALEVAQRITRHSPCVERVRFTTSGSEATFHAMRMARAFTGRDKILKFEGGYHGNHDYAQLSTAPKSVADFPTPVPDTAGIPKAVQDLVLIAPYNNLAATRQIVAANANDLAAIIVEPIQRIISPQPGFLEGLRKLTQEFGCLLIFDEVVTGWRLALGGAQEHYGVVPDLAAFAKILGGGLPVGAVGGRADIMDQCDPAQKGKPGYVYQNGTLYGNPLGAAAALATLTEMEKPGVFDQLFRRGEDMRAGLRKIVSRHGLDAVVIGYGPMWHVLFGGSEPRNYRDLLSADAKKLIAFDTELIRQGFFVLPGNRRFVSLAHTDSDLEDSFAAFDAACRKFRG